MVGAALNIYTSKKENASHTNRMRFQLILSFIQRFPELVFKGVESGAGNG